MLGARPLADDLSRWVAFSHRRLPWVLQSAARQEASQQRRLDKKKAEREKVTEVKERLEREAAEPEKKKRKQSKSEPQQQTLTAYLQRHTTKRS